MSGKLTLAEALAMKSGRYPSASRTARREVGRMNKTEEAYSKELDRKLLVGEIAMWKFEALKLRLADKTFYDTDFLVITSAGTVEIHEVKGFMEDDAAVKLKVAAEQFPFRFWLVKRDKQEWSYCEV